GLRLGSQTYQIEVVTKDSQSNPNRAAEVAKELITRDNVSLVLVGATPETNNPVATQCELEQVPCISSLAPWQTNFIGRQANPARKASDQRWCPSPRPCCFRQLFRRSARAATTFRPRCGGRPAILTNRA